MIAILSDVCCVMVLICIILRISDVEHLFMYLLDICWCSLEKYLFRSPPIFSLVYLSLFLFFVELCEFPMYLGFNSYLTYGLQILSLFCRLLLYSVNFLFHCAESFHFDVVSLVYLVFCCLCFGCSIHIILKELVSHLF